MRIGRLYDPFKQVDARSNKIDEQFPILRSELDSRFLEIDPRFLEVDSRFLELHQSSVAQSTNSQAASLRDRIFRTAIIKPSLPSRFQLPPPSHFPDTVMRF